MFQDSVPAGSYNDPFLSSVCVCVGLCWCVCVFSYAPFQKKFARAASLTVNDGPVNRGFGELPACQAQKLVN